jgi:uncharacterized protein (DUF305 family)
MFSSTTIKTITIAAATAAALMVAGCSNGSDTSATSSSPGMSGSMPGMDHGGSSTSASAAPSAARSDFNDSDVTFLQMMYPHHAQAVDMSKLVEGRTQNQQVITLAQNIEKAQGPEMTQMTDLLASFGKPAPTAGSGHSGMDMPGMMSAGQMTSLEGLSGPAFDRMWLQMMIDHHTGAIDMSNTELRDGSNPDAKKMAQAIIANQEAEITQMRGMLG